MVSLRPGCAALGVVSASDIVATAALCGGVCVAGWCVWGVVVAFSFDICDNT